MRILLILFLFVTPAFAQVQEAGPLVDSDTLAWDRFHRNDGENSDRMSGEHGNLTGEVHWIGSQATIGIVVDGATKSVTVKIVDGVPTIEANTFLDLIAGSGATIRPRSVFDFSGVPLGPRAYLYGTAYQIGVEDFTWLLVTDRLFEVRNDTGNRGWLLNADTGEQTLSGDIQAAGHSIRSASRGYFREGVIYTIRPETTREALLQNTEEGQEFYWVDDAG